MTWGDVPRRRRIAGGNPPMRPDQAAAQPRTRAGSGPAPSSSVVVARLVIIVGATGALFVYSPVVGAGNLLASLAAAAGVDSFGNPFDAGLTVGPHAGAHIGLGLTGDLFVHNASGTAIVDQIHAADGSIRVYTSAGVALGNLTTSISPVAGTDVPGNAYTAGIYQQSATRAVQIFAGLIEFFNLASTPAVIPNVQAAGSAAGSGLQLTSGTATGASAAILTLQDSLLSTLGLFPVMQFNGGMSLTALLSSGAGAAFQGNVAAASAVLTQAAAGSEALGVLVTGDSNRRLSVHADGSLNWGSGGGAADVSLSRQSAGILQILTGDLDIATIGNGLRIKEGTNARMGTAVLVAGTVTVANTSITAATRLFLTCQVLGGTQGILRVAGRTVGTQFIITSSNAADTSTVAWLLVEPG